MSSPDDARCGEGTIFDSSLNACVPFVFCGSGTVEDPATGTCEPIAVCGDNTFFDAATRSCVPAAACADGTVANVDTHLCESPVSCGAGTALDDVTRECRPLPPCTDGAVLDEQSGLCVGDIVCGPGQVGIDGGLCVDPSQALALEVDVTESVGQNDPAMGGTAEQLQLEPLGERAVFLGGIDRAQDFDGDGVVDQDRDVWAFDALAGDYLSVRVLSLGLAGPAFVVDGPRGYQRTSAIAVEPDAERELLLPYDGRYTVTVVPGAFLSTSVPAGALTARYVGAIERRALPALVDVSAPATVAGDLFALDDNFFRIQADARTALQITLQQQAPDAPASVLVFSRNNDAAGALSLLSNIQELDEGDWAGLFVPDGAVDVFFVVDWRSADGAGDDYTVALTGVPLVENGALPADITIETPPLDLLGHETGAWQLLLDEAQLVEVDVLVSFDPDVQIVGPTGTHAIVDDSDLFFFYAEPGEYVVFVNNDANGDDDGAALALTLFAPFDMGTLSTSSAPVSMTGPTLNDTRGGPSEAWAIARVPASSLLALDLDAAAGDPDLLVFDESGAPVRGLDRAHVRGALHVQNDDARALLISVRANAGSNECDNLIDWSLRASLSSLPAQPEQEPNDTHDRATDLGVIDASDGNVIVRGRLGPKQTDLYVVELEAPLAPGRALRVSFDDLGVTGAGLSVSDGSSLMIYDEQRQPLGSLPFSTTTTTVSGESVEVREGALGPNTLTFVPPMEGQGPFYIELFKLFDTSDSLYVLALDIVTLGTELEPNDDAQQAQPLPLPASLVGWRATGDVADLYRISLAESAALVVEWENLESNNDITVSLETALTGAVLATQARVLGALIVPNVAAGEYSLRVTGAGATEAAYALRARVDAGGAVATEPNDDVAGAAALGTLTSAALEITGEVSDVDADTLTFTLAQPLASSEGLRIEVLNSADTTNLTAELWSGNVMHATNTFDAALLSSAPAGTGPFHLVIRQPSGSAAAPDRYIARIARAGAAEREPNDDQQSATQVSLPVALEGNLHAGDVDVFRLDVAEATTVDAAFANLDDTTALRITLRLADFTELGSTSSDDGRVTGIFLPSGTYYLEISPVSPNSTGDHYRLLAQEAAQ